MLPDTKFKKCWNAQCCFIVKFNLSVLYSYNALLIILITQSTFMLQVLYSPNMWAGKKETTFQQDLILNMKIVKLSSCFFSLFPPNN